MSISDYLASGSNDPTKQVSVTAWNAVINLLATVEGNFVTLNSTQTITGLKTINNDLKLTRDTSPTVAPQIYLRGYAGSWLSPAIDVTFGGADLVLASRLDRSNGNAGDLVYIAHNGQVHTTTTSQVSASATVPVASTTGIATGMVVHGTGIVGYPTVSAIGVNQVTLSTTQTISSGTDLEFENSPTIGLGLTPPAKGTFRVQISPPDSEPGMGSLGVRVHASQTGDAIRVYDQTNAMKWKIDSAGYFSTVNLRDAATPADILTFAQNGLSVVYAWKYEGTSLRFRYSTGAINLMQFDADGTVYVYNALNALGPVICDSYARLKSYTVAGVPSAATAAAGAMIYVSNESGGATPAFSDGTNWRRVADRAIIS